MNLMKTTANKITLCRILLVPVFLVLFYLNKHIPALIVFLLACFSDLLDGYVARNYNQISVFGKFMDPLADKMLVISAMCCFIDAGRMAGWAVATVCFREFAVSGLRLIAAEKKCVIAAAKLGKLKTAVTMICLAAMLLFTRWPLLDDICTAVILLTTVGSGIEYFIKNSSVFTDGIEGD